MNTQSFTHMHLDVATTLAEGFRYLSYEDDVLVSKWLGSCAAALEADKSAAFTYSGGGQEGAICDVMGQAIAFLAIVM